MTLKLLGLNLVLGALIFLINLKLGRLQGRFTGFFQYESFRFQSKTGQNFSGNFFQKIVTPAILLSILCAVLQALSRSDLIAGLWLAVPSYWVIRLLVIVLENRVKYINWKYEFFSLAASLALSEGTLFLLILPLIGENEPIFMELTEFRDAFWFAAIAYAATTFWKIINSAFHEKNIYPDEKRRGILTERYVSLSKKFGAFVDEQISAQCGFKSRGRIVHFRQLVFAIMIYEDYNRPFMARLFEYMVFSTGLKKEMTLGIMQTKTKHWMSSRRSIMEAIPILYASFDDSLGIHVCVEAAIRSYNPGEFYFDEVFEIYGFLTELNHARPEPIENPPADGASGKSATRILSVRPVRRRRGSRKEQRS